MATPPDNPIDAVQMKRDIQARMHEETHGMSVEERIAYYRRGADEFRRQIEQEAGSDPSRFRALLDALSRRDQVRADRVP
ncbi:MAG: hypothetical protein ACF8R7_12385 [Phycisphaerales bacterium JB039]